MQNRKGFTLVELIVVITILAILGTIAFISLQGYSSESRDSKRISDLGQIRTGLQIEQAKEGEVPMPENAVSIGTGSTTLLYQGYAGTGTLNELRVSEAKDPVEDVHYTYTTNFNRTKFQLVAMLENEEISYNTNSIIPTTYSDYENRVPFVIGDPLGILLDSTNTPIQELSFPDNEVDLSEGEEYTLVTTREDTITSSGSELVATIEESSNNTGGNGENNDGNTGGTGGEGGTGGNNEPTSPAYVGGTTYSKGETFSYDGGDWYVSGNGNVAYTKDSGSNDIPNDLTASDNILVFENGTGSLVKGTTAFVIRTVNEGATEPYIYGTEYGSGNLWNEGSIANYGSDSAARKISYEADKDMLGDYYQWGRNDAVSLLDTTAELYDGGLYQTGGVNLSGSGFIFSTELPLTWMTESKHDLSKTVIWTDDNENSGVCPTDYHLPTIPGNEGGEWEKVTELVTLITSSWTTTDREKLQKYLLLPMAGHRDGDSSSGDYDLQGKYGIYWSTSVAGVYGRALNFTPSGINPNNSTFRANGHSVRCFKN